MKADIAANESARLAELRALEILDTLPEPSFDDLVRLATFVCGTSGALVSLVDEHRQWFKARIGFEAPETPREQSLCAHAILEPQQLMVVPDAAADHRFAKSPLVASEPNIRFYAAAPLTTSTGQALGTLCVFDRTPRTLSDEQQVALQSLARQAVYFLESRRLQIIEREQAKAQAALIEASRQLEEAQRTGRIGSYRFNVKTDFWTSTATLNEIFGITDPGFAYNVQGWLQIIHPEERAELSRYFQEDVLAARRPFDKEYRIIRLNDGKERWVHSLAKMVLNDKGEPVEIIGTAQDITDRKLAQLAMENERTLLRTLIDLMPDSIYVKDLEGRFLLANRTVTHRVGLDDPSEMLGKSDDDFFEPAVAARLHADDERVLSGESIINQEESLTSLNFVQTTKLTTKIPFHDHTGKICGLVGMGRDITERKQAEAARAESEFRLRAILDAEPECVKLLDSDCRLLEMNPAGLAMIEADSLAQVVGQDVCPILLEKFREPFRSLNRRVFEGQTGAMEYEILGLKGARRWLDTRVTPLRDMSGKIIAALGVTRDITDQKHVEQALLESEARYRLLLDKAPAPMFVQTNQRFAYANEALLKIVGANHHLQLLGERILDFVAPESQDIVAERMRMAGERSLVELTEQVKILRLDGRHTDVEVCSVPTEFNGHQGSLVFINDISQRLRHEATLLEAKAAAEAGSAAKSEFLAMMSHEIRTPMNGVLGMANLLLDSNLAPQQRRLVEILRDSGSDLLVIINDILDFSKIEAGKLSVELLPVDLRAAVEEIIDLLWAKARKKKIELLLRFAPGTPAGIVTDRIRLRQILLNLADNAIKFTAQGHVLIEVSCLAKTAVEAQIQFAITDTGLGIPKDKQHRLFQKFSQADQSTTRKFGGTGLGLAICKQLVELLGGSISLKSSAGQGSTFYFNIPFPLAPTVEAFSPALGKIRGRRVLVVSASSLHRELLREQLTAWKIHTETAATAADALACLRVAQEAGLPLDTVLADHSLPELDAAALARDLSAVDLLHTLRLIALSAEDTGETDAGLRVAGIECCLVKPLREQKLFECLAGQNGDTAQPATEPSAVVPTAPAPQLNLSVLVAEDNPTGQIIAAAMLEKLGCRADIAANGLEAVQLFEKNSYDVVFMDWHMPVMDGAEATTKIRALTRNRRRVPIIAFTAGVQAAERETLEQAGVDDFIMKPATRKSLEEVITRWTKPANSAPGQPMGPDCATTPAVSPLPFNEEEALGFVDGDRELLGQLATSFCETAPGLLDNLHAAIAQRDFKAATIAAHTLKGSARMFAAASTVAAAFAAEQAGKAGDWPPLETAVRLLEIELARLLPELLKLNTVIV